MFTLYSYAFVVCVALTVGRSSARSNMILNRESSSVDSSSSSVDCSCSYDSSDVQLCSDLPHWLLLSASYPATLHTSSYAGHRGLYMCCYFNQSLEYLDVRTLPMFMSPDAVTRRQNRHSVRRALRLRAKAQRSSTCSVLASFAAVLRTIPALLLLFIRSVAVTASMSIVSRYRGLVHLLHGALRNAVPALRPLCGVYTFQLQNGVIVSFWKIVVAILAGVAN